jgi:hypothetical protein
MSSYSSSDEISLTGKCLDYCDDASFSISSSQMSDSDELSYTVYADDEHVIDRRQEKAMRDHKKVANVCRHRVTFGKRQEVHRHDTLSKGNCIFIDGLESPTLIMHPGVTYVFSVVQDGDAHDFVLTKSSMGHSQHMSCDPIRGAPLPVTHGEYVYTAGAHTPASFFYQSSKDTWYGGHVNCHQ